MSDRIHVHWSDEDKGYIATTDDWPYLSGWGDDEDDARAALKEAIELADELEGRD